MDRNSQPKMLVPNGESACFHLDNISSNPAAKIYRF